MTIFDSGLARFYEDLAKENAFSCSESEGARIFARQLRLRLEAWSNGAAGAEADRIPDLAA